MALEIANDFMADDNPDVVRYITGNREAKEVYNELLSLDYWSAVLFNEYWHSYRITGRVPERHAA